MTIETAPALYRREDAAGTAHEAKVSRIDISQQVRRQRAAIASSALAGSCFTIAAVLGFAAYTGGGDPVPPLVIGSFFSLSGVFFGAYAVGVSGRVLGYLQGSEELIFFLAAKITGLKKKVTSLSLRLSLREGAGLEGEAVGEGSGAPTAAIVPFNKRH